MPAIAIMDDIALTTATATATATATTTTATTTSCSTSTATPDFLSRDVEELVSEIKENLRLKAKPDRKERRVSPYPTKRPQQTPPPPPQQPQDPYEALQRLLESNKLVAEAVRRLQEDLTSISRPPRKQYLYPEEESESVVLPPICRHLKSC